MKAVTTDMQLFFRRAREKLYNLFASNVDDTLACSDHSFGKLTKKTREKFEMETGQKQRHEIFGSISRQMQY